VVKVSLDLVVLSQSQQARVLKRSLVERLTSPVEVLWLALVVASK
jgi:hypothetical protein